MSNLDKEAPVTETEIPSKLKLVRKAVPPGTTYDSAATVDIIPVVKDSPPVPATPIPIIKDSPPFPDNIPVRYDGGKAPVGA